MVLTDKQTNDTKNITSFAKEIIKTNQHGPFDNVLRTPLGKKTRVTMKNTHWISHESTALIEVKHICRLNLKLPQQNSTRKTHPLPVRICNGNFPEEHIYNG